MAVDEDHRQLHFLCFINDRSSQLVAPHAPSNPEFHRVERDGEFERRFLFQSGKAAAIGLAIKSTARAVLQGFTALCMDEGTIWRFATSPVSYQPGEGYWVSAGASTVVQNADTPVTKSSGRLPPTS
ncbi:hypothetical protein E1B28_009806 [Marasmius oreades]|uniref:Uncharacterized protein n=1 Tax=Marasmius oreades TaxID=181124 RepID=A0A9P7RWH8_9AGAR|nr:uncharacterized protein E1B28_009806 [Marasmius oreades]KAG7090712.1 hypothetical protein E1B28_009806 [Marasmius oreades]